VGLVGVFQRLFRTLVRSLVSFVAMIYGCRAISVCGKFVELPGSLGGSRLALYFPSRAAFRSVFSTDGSD
jgi:hypothetical protein